MKGMMLFTEVEKSLNKVKSQFEGLTLNLRGSLKEFSDIEEMLKEEKSEFEVCTRNISGKFQFSCVQIRCIMLLSLLAKAFS